MRVIDAHVHLSMDGLFPEAYVLGVARTMKRIIKTKMKMDLPIEEVSTGNIILIVPVKSLFAIQKANGNANNLSEFFKNRTAIAPYLFTLETTNVKAKVHTRFFMGHGGIMEDAATGSAAGPLTAYLLKYRVFGEDFEIQNEQGIEMGRPSRILMKGEVKDNRYTIKIGGKCVYVGSGHFEI